MEDLDFTEVPGKAVKALSAEFVGTTLLCLTVTSTLFLADDASYWGPISCGTALMILVCALLLAD